MPARVSLVLVEDNHVFRETLELLLEYHDDIEVVGSVANGADAAELCRRMQPDVVLVDYRMPVMNGADATRAVLAASPRSRVICLTAAVSNAEVDRLLEAGAVACITKDENLDRILTAIRDAAALPA